MNSNLRTEAPGKIARPAGRATRVMLVDDHAVVRAGYRRLLELEPDLHVVEEHAEGDSAFAALARGPAPPVDVLVLDLSMPGRSGLDLLHRLARRWPALATLVFSMHDSPAMVGQALRAGAAGFVTKSSPPEELVSALRRVAAGECGVLSADLAAAAGSAAAKVPVLALSPREFDVLRLLVQGASLEEAAARLHLSPKTVSNVQSLLRQKLGVGNAIDMLRYAQEHKLFGV